MRLLAADAWRFVERAGQFRKLPTPELPGSGKGYSALCGSQPYGAPVFMSAHSIRAGGQNVKPADIFRPGGAYVIPLQSWNAGRRDMKADPEQRAVQLGEYIAAHNATVRAAAAAFGCSKSTVHKDVAVRLRSISPVRAGARRAGPQQGRAPPAGRGCHPAQIQPPLKPKKTTALRSGLFCWDGTLSGACFD